MKKKKKKIRGLGHPFSRIGHCTVAIPDIGDLTFATTKPETNR